MWAVFRALLVQEVRDLWRRLLRRPEPPNRFSRFRER